MRRREGGVCVFRYAGRTAAAAAITSVSLFILPRGNAEQSQWGPHGETVHGRVWSASARRERSGLRRCGSAKSKRLGKPEKEASFGTPEAILIGLSV